MNLFVKQLQGINASIGNHIKCWNNNMSLFVSGRYNDIFCINISYTQLCVRKILNIIKNSTIYNKIVFFIVPPFVLFKSLFQQGFQKNKPLAWNIRNISLITVATWIFGILTNFKVVNRRYKFLPLNKLPELSFILINKITDHADSINISREVANLKSLSFGLVDTSQNPYTFNYPVPSNSKAFETVVFFYRFFCSYFFMLHLKLYSAFFNNLMYLKIVQNFVVNRY